MTLTDRQAILSLGHDDTAKPLEADERFYSVTTIIGALDKPDLTYWAADETAKAAVRLAGSLAARVAEEGEDTVTKYLADARFRKPEGYRSATELGTAVHDAVEQYALTGTRPVVDAEVLPYLDAFDRWATEFQPEYLAAEAAIFNRTFGYAGTLDAIVKIGGQTVIIDYKSTRRTHDNRGNPTGPYPEVALQLAGYRHAELIATFRARRMERYRRRYYLLSPDERVMAAPMPEVQGAVVLHLTPEHARAFPVRTDQAVYDAFLYVLEAFRWQQDLSKRVIGPPLEPPPKGTS